MFYLLLIKVIAKASNCTRTYYRTDQSRVWKVFKPIVIVRHGSMFFSGITIFKSMTFLQWVMGRQGWLFDDKKRQIFISLPALPSFLITSGSVNVNVEIKYNDNKTWLSRKKCRIFLDLQDVVCVLPSLEWLMDKMLVPTLGHGRFRSVYGVDIFVEDHW